RRAENHRRSRLSEEISRSLRGAAGARAARCLCGLSARRLQTVGRGHQEGKRKDRVRPHGGVPRGPTKLRANTAETAIVNAVLLATARLRTQHLAAMQQLSLIDDLETAIKQGNPASRVETLRRITDLFLHDADRLNDEQISVFDDVLCLLAEKIEKTALVELGSRLAPVDMSPIKVVRRLARDDQIEVAAPVLIGSRRLSTA